MEIEKIQKQIAKEFGSSFENHYYKKIFERVIELSKDKNFVRRKHHELN